MTDTATDAMTSAAAGTAGGGGAGGVAGADGAGIQDAAGFAAFVQQYEPARLFTQFFEEPFEFLQERLAGHLSDREAGAILDEWTITGPPVPRGDGHPDYDDPDYGDPEAGDPPIVLTRVALFVPFTAEVFSPSQGLESVQGALTCVLGNANQPDNQVVRSWMDVDDFGLYRLMTPDVEQYQARMLSVGRWLPEDYAPGTPEREGLGAAALAADTDATGTGPAGG